MRYSQDHQEWDAAGRPATRWHWRWYLNDGEFDDAVSGPWGVADDVATARGDARTADPSPGLARRLWERLRGIRSPGVWWCVVRLQEAREVNDIGFDLDETDSFADVQWFPVASTEGQPASSEAYREGRRLVWLDS